MNLALITAKQVFELFLMIAAGILLQKKGLIRTENKNFLSDLLMKFVVPCMILDSYMGTSDTKVLAELGRSFGYSLILCVVGIVITLALTGLVREENRAVFRFACSFSNAAYMGFPLVRALFGEEGILYAGAYVTVFNILLWTVGSIFFANKMSVGQLVKNLLHCPPILAVAAGLVLSFGRIPVADVIAEPIGLVGEMTTPLSMLITGAALAEAGVISLLGKKNLWTAAAVRLLVIPAACIFLFWLLGITGTAAKVTLLLEACPAAAITTMFAVWYDKDEQYAAAVVAVTTFLSILTLPACAYLL